MDKSYKSQLLKILEREGFIIEKKTDYHYRINNSLDIYPNHNKWHNLILNSRGQTNDLLGFIRLFFELKIKPL